jgi:hypothetical protein
MIDLEIIGGIKKDRELIDQIVWWCIGTLMSRHSVLDVEIRFEKTIDHGAFAFCHYGDTNRQFIIEIDPSLSQSVSKFEFVETIVHEMIHVWQGATGRMKYRFRGGYQQLWKCKDGKYRNYGNTKYERQPWETEAYRLQGPMTKMFMEKFNYD